MLRYSTMATPAGPLTAVVSDAGAVRAAGFTADVRRLAGADPSGRCARRPGRRTTSAPVARRGPVLSRR